MIHRWNEAAKIRKEQIESGKDITFSKVFVPLFREFLGVIRPARALEIGGGTGHLALNLKEFCKDLYVIEPSSGMYNVAQSVLFDSNVKLIQETSYNFNVECNFDLAYSHLCAHTTKNINSFLDSIRRLLRKDGRFIYSIPHPVFYEIDRGNQAQDYMAEWSALVDLEISLDKENPIKSIPYVHRSLSKYINATIDAGFSIQELIEVWPRKNVMRKYNIPWKGPRYCVFICNVCR